MICHLHNIWPWKRTHCPYVCSRCIKKGPYILHMLHKNFTVFAESNLNFYFAWKFASPWKSISHCKLFEVIWMYIVLCLHIKFVKGPPSALLLYFEKHMTCSRACGSRVVHQLSNRTAQKLSGKVSKRGPATSLKKGGPETTALFAFPNIHPCS